MSEKSEIHKERSSNFCSGTLEMVGKMELFRRKLAQWRTNHDREGKFRVSQDL